MSTEAMAWAFAQPIPPAPKMVLLALSNNADKHGKNCFPSLRTIVENCTPMKVRTVQYHLKWLAEVAKLITITPWFQPSGRQTSNLYELCLSTSYCGEGAKSCTEGRVQKVAPGRVQKVASLLNPENLDLRKKEEDPPSPQAGGADVVVPVNTEEFDQFWDAFPNKVGKKAARRSWERATDKPGIIEILQAIVRAKKGERWQRGYIPNPATWLNQGRWADVVETPAVGPGLPKAYQPTPATPVRGEACPPEVAAKLARILGRETFSWPAAEVAV